MNNLADMHVNRAINNEKSSIVTILLFLFLGGFGIHRFYAQGATTFNIFYLLTGGYFLVGIIVDFFLVWNMADKANVKRLEEARNSDVMERMKAERILKDV